MTVSASGTSVRVAPDDGREFTSDVRLEMLGTVAAFLAWHDPESQMSAEDSGADTRAGFEVPVATPEQARALARALRFVARRGAARRAETFA